MEYEVVEDIRQKEKIVGGLFTLSQTVFLVAGVVLGFVTGSAVFSLAGSVPAAVIAGAVAAALLMPFAFVKIPRMGDMELARFLGIVLRYARSQKVWPNVNEHEVHHE